MAEEQPAASSGRRVAVIAAAGRGTRFQHEHAGIKVLADVGGRPCLQRVIDAVEEGLDDHLQIIVVGHEAEAIQEAIGPAPHRRYVVQSEPRGTGHALLCALNSIDPQAAGEVYFFCGDKPLLRGETVRRFREEFETGASPMLFLTGHIDGGEEHVRDSRQGRVVTVDHDGHPHALAIVERKVIDGLNHGQTFHLSNGVPHFFSREQLLRIREVNVSTYAWSLRPLRGLAQCLSADNPQGEFLVTDLVHIFLRHGLPVRTLNLEDPKEGMGIDTVQQWLEVRAQC